MLLLESNYCIYVHMIYLNGYAVRCRPLINFLLFFLILLNATCFLLKLIGLPYLQTSTDSFKHANEVCLSVIHMYNLCF